MIKSSDLFELEGGPGTDCWRLRRTHWQFWNGNMRYSIDSEKPCHPEIVDVSLYSSDVLGFVALF
jgi:hypothetical protein